MLTDAQVFLSTMGVGAFIGAIGIWAAIAGRRERNRRSARQTSK